MKKPNIKTILYVAGGLAVVGVLYFMLKPKTANASQGSRRQGSIDEQPDDQNDVGGYDYGNDVTPQPGPQSPEKFGYSKYQVVTQTSNLNIRKEASTSSAIIGSLPKGSIIYAKKHVLDPAWYVTTSPNGSVTETGCYDCGFVSAQYIKKI